MAEFGESGADEPWQEDEYLVDCELDIDGTLLTPENTRVHHFQPECWDSLEVSLGEEETVDVLVEIDVIRAMRRSGYRSMHYGHPTDGYKAWYIMEATKHLDAELESFYDEQGYPNG